MRDSTLYSHVLEQEHVFLVLKIIWMIFGVLKTETFSYLHFARRVLIKSRKVCVNLDDMYIDPCRKVKNN